MTKQRNLFLLSVEEKRKKIDIVTDGLLEWTDYSDSLQRLCCIDVFVFERETDVLFCVDLTDRRKELRQGRVRL